MTDRETTIRIAEQMDEFWNERNLALAEEFIAEEFVGHMIGDDDLHGRDEYTAWAEGVAAMFPDFELEFEPMFVEDELLCGQWTLTGTHEGLLPDLGIEPTGKEVEFSGLFIDRLADGRVVEMWHQIDYLTLMQQLGAISE
ncbi:ester cyclase [Haloplanus aerogenes]|uniref:Ester cyclase n=1 Tax=Haloplanus aerogenes TaxID=660522 RepID=A0A3M0D2N1_9EURY|nr:ester cyclase [Haloplanus aerogenes]AZH25173.1 ester cyclase [Haloplanus aerogenes]RMB13599.1 putative ester cyclase [Haloplanus aerogenes]